MFILCQVLLDCQLSPFPRTLYPQDSAQSIFFTQKGIQKWFASILNGGELNITGQKFPDQIFTINLGVTKIDMMLTDIIVTEFEVNQVQVVLQNNNVVPLILAGCRFVLRFNWRIQQSSYPYISDSGTGNVIVGDTDFSTLFGVDCDYIVCPNHLLAKFLHGELNIGTLQVLLYGGSSWMYQSMINLLVGLLQQELQRFITYFMSNNVVDILNNLFDNYKSSKNYKRDTNIIKDERFVSPWMVKDGYLYLLFSGYMYHELNKSDEFISTDMIGEVTYNRFNVEMEITISQAAFNNVYYIFHKYEDAYSSQYFTVLKAPTIQFMNSAALLSVQIKVNDSTVNIQLQGLPVYFREANEKGNCIIYFQFLMYSIESDQDLDFQLLEEQVLENINTAMRRTFYMLMSSDWYEIEKYKFEFDTHGQVVRLVLIADE
ncbi:Conserved_hypothetical protein [Hexamita inflata]|uniref:BPI-like protein n=1 Tax=Hexamita inflata TaxID=28002 RepID=A0AA86QSB2_9EUKA|nr:Conserved hypothetical protein [Hexamita inflata]